MAQTKHSALQSNITPTQDNDNKLLAVNEANKLRWRYYPNWSDLWLYNDINERGSDSRWDLDIDKIDIFEIYWD